MKRKTSNELSLKEAMDRMVDKKGLRRGIDQLEVEAAWDKVFTGLIAKHTNSITLSRGKLTVKVDSAPLRQELSYMRVDMVSKLNEALGRELIEEIVLR